MANFTVLQQAQLSGAIFEYVNVQAGHDVIAVTYHTRDEEWELLRDFWAWNEKRRVFIEIPKGFRFDLASVPRAFWWAIAPFELSLIAPLTHDYLYRTKGMGVYTRAQADELFNEHMKLEGVPTWRRVIAYAAVRAFGAEAWNN